MDTAISSRLVLSERMLAIVSGIIEEIPCSVTTMASTNLSHSSVSGSLDMESGGISGSGNSDMNERSSSSSRGGGLLDSKFSEGSNEPISRITAGILDGSGGGPGSNDDSSRVV